jgi:uncharacterized protein
MPMPEPPADLAGLPLAEIVRLVGEAKRPPVDQWQPARTGHSNIRIAGDGSWHHEGRPINREAMVRLFSTILRREPDGSFVLVTPAEKLTIDVDDTPFLAVEVKSVGEGRDHTLAFRLNTGDLVVADAEHPLRLEERADGPQPLLQVRPGLDARLVRPVYYELAELALAEDGAPPGLWSGGIFHPLAS